MFMRLSTARDTGAVRAPSKTKCQAGTSLARIRLAVHAACRASGRGANMPKTLLVKNADVVVTMDPARREIRNGGLFVADHRIVAVGPTAELPQTADEVLDLKGHIVIPGLINTHHHMFQTLTRAWPAAQNVELFDWLTALFPVWQRLTPEMIKVSTKTAMAELLLSGCTTSMDHLYLYPNGCRLDDEVEAAREIGMRFHASRGAMSVGASKGGLPPDSLIEDEGAIVKDMLRVIDAYNDAGRFSMLRIVVAPCSPFTVSRDLMCEAVKLARSRGVGMHSHLAESDKHVAYSLERFHMTPAQYAEEVGWVGSDVWHAHCVKLDDHGIGLFGRTGTGVAHCPCSNMRQMAVHADAEAARELDGFAHQVPAHGERRARRYHDAQHRKPAGVVIGVNDTQHVLDDCTLVFDQAVGRQAAFARADAHGAAARMKTHPDLTGGLDLVVKSAAVRVEIKVVHRRGAARQEQFRHGGLGRNLDHLRRQTLPHRKQRGQPVEQLDVLRSWPCTGQRLEHVVMCVDEARNDNVAFEIEHFVGRLRQLGGRPDGDDAMVSNKQAAVSDLTPRRLHRHHDIGILDQQGLRHVCSSPARSARGMYCKADSCKTGSSLALRFRGGPDRARIARGREAHEHRLRLWSWPAASAHFRRLGKVDNLRGNPTTPGSQIPSSAPRLLVCAPMQKEIG